MPHLEESESEAGSSSETSDHYREAMTTTSEVSTEDEEAQTVFLSTSRQKEAVMHKGEWRHVRGHLAKIREYMQEEIERRGKEESRTCTASAREAKAVAETRLPACPGSRKR